MERAMTRQALFERLGGRHKYYRLRTIYRKARPQRTARSPTILTADEVFLLQARENGFSDEQISSFFEHIDL